MRPVNIGSRSVGNSSSVFVIAEAGVNHDGRLDRAHELVDVAADTGADAVKFQTFRTEALVTETAATTPYQQRANAGHSQADMLRALALPEGAWSELAAHARERDIVFLSTPFDVASAEMLLQLGVPALKIGSGELTNHRLLAALSRLGVPLLLSTGMATEMEVDRALDITSSAPAVALFHCVSAYPAPHAEANLRVIPRMIDRYDVPVGWSDHTVGDLTALGAVALGACLIEKHVTTDRTLSGPDHAASLEPATFTAYVRALRSLSEALGDGIKRRMPSEEVNAPLVRRSWHAARTLAPGHVVRHEDLVPLRPEAGISTDQEIVGRRIVRDVSEGSAVTADALGSP